MIAKRKQRFLAYSNSTPSPTRYVRLTDKGLNVVLDNLLKEIVLNETSIHKCVEDRHELNVEIQRLEARNMVLRKDIENGS